MTSRHHIFQTEKFYLHNIDETAKIIYYNKEQDKGIDGNVTF